MGKEILVIGHRGASGLAPENTMPSFERALAEGADWVECDVRTTKDERFVIVHDSTLDRTTSGEGRVKDWPLHKIRALDAGSWFHPKYRGEHVPILEEVLDWAKERMGLILDCKTADPKGLALLLKRFVMTKGVVVAFESLAEIRKFRAADPKTPVALTLAKPASLIAVAKAGCQMVDLKSGLWNASYAQKAASLGIGVNVWTVNTEREIQGAAAHEPAGLISDYPDRVRRALTLTAGKI